MRTLDQRPTPPAAARCPLESYPRHDPGRAVIESGLAAHLNVNGPVPARRVADAIETVNRRGATMTIFDSAGAA